MKTKKHPNAKLENYSKIFSLLGLVLSLFVALNVIQSKSYANQIIPVAYDGPVDKDEVENNIKYKIKEPPKPKPKLVKDISKIIEKPDDDPIVETNFIVDDPDDTFDLNKVDEFDEGPEFDPVDAVPFIAVEIGPLYPGCEGTKEEKKECFSKQIGKFIQRRFDADLAQTLGLSPGVKRIFVLFEVDKEGNVTNIQARAPHKRLQEEAISILQKLPKMEPGMQQGRKVPVNFSIPISFKVE